MRLIAKTLYGLEEVLASELEQLGARNIKPANRAVYFTGNVELLYTVNYCSRTALSVLKPIAEFFINTKDDLYKQCSAIDWIEYMDADDTFAVIPVVNSNLFGHTGYPALVVKDAIVDYFRERSGRRPSVNTTDPMITVNLHVSNTRVTISLDSTVIPLYKRGYRVEHGEASLNEVLAAGMLKLANWDKSSYLLDPMCGSGTIVIEAALMAANVPPGQFRKSFGFMNWKDYDDKLFERVKYRADGKILAENINIAASDISEKAVAFTRENLEKAGMLQHVNVTLSDIRDVIPPEGKGMVMMNPPYGQRIVPGDIEQLYSDIGTALKHKFAGYKAWIITSDKQYLNKVGLKSMKKYNLFNGSIECQFVGYELFAGNRSDFKKNQQKL